MADKRKAPLGSDAARKRKAPTIDLTATDVTPPPQPAAEPQPTAEPSPEPARETVAAADAPAEPPPPPPDEPPQTAPEPDAMPPLVAPITEQRRGASVGAMLLAGIAGGAVVAAALGGIWYAGMLPQRQQAQVQPDMKASQQIAQMQREVEALKNRPAPTADSKATDALAQRVVQIETALKDMPKAGGPDPQLAQKFADLQNTVTPLAQRLASAESAVKSGDTAIAALGKRIDDIAGNAAEARQDADAAAKGVTRFESQLKDLARNQASTVTRADIEAVQQKLSGLEKAVQAARDGAKQSAAAAAATRLALAAQGLRNAVAGGAPYRAELAQAKALGADANKLAALEPFAASGLPGAPALAQQLRELIPQMKTIAAPRAQASGTFLEKLQANAGNLVRISPASAPSGDQTADVLARLEVEAARNDVAAAANDVAKLPQAAQAPARDWLARVHARQAALAAADELAASSARALTQGAQ